MAFGNSCPLRSASDRPRPRKAALMRARQARRGLAAAVVSAAVISTAAGCGGDDGASALPPLDTTAATTSPSPTPTEDPDAWKSDYDEDQLRAFDEALAVWQEYEEKSEPIWAAGKATADAEKLFKKYWTTWANTLNTLSKAEEFGARSFGLPEVIWSRASRVKLTESGAADVAIRQCIDPSTVKTEFAPDVQVQKRDLGPSVRTITLFGGGGSDGTWRIRSLADVTTEKEVERCGR